MKINSSSVGMESARSYTAVSMNYRRFEITDYTGAETNAANLADKMSNGAISGQTDESDQATNAANTGSVFLKSNGNFATVDDIKELQQQMSSVRPNYKIRTSDTTNSENFRQQTVMYILKLLFGEKIDKKDLENAENSDDAENSNNLGLISGDIGNTYTNVAQIMQTPVSTMNYLSVHYEEESEETQFSTQGTVRTADGREINFNLDVSMSREFCSYYENDLNIQYTQLCDPLVINLDGNVASVSDQRVSFDIDGDGRKESVGRLSMGSGYLALDKNDDGTINDGSELFGTESGDGFADLAQYDEDGNGWIDENDSVWDKLKVLCYDDSGKETVYKLAETGAGALCLNRLDTEFTQKDENQNTMSVIRSTGIFLYENGNAGSLQQLDLAVFGKEA